MENKNTFETIAKAKEGIRAFLNKQGYMVISSDCEIDGTEIGFIAEEGGELVFVAIEVQEAGGETLLDGAITRQEFERIAVAYLVEHSIPDTPVRADSISLKVMPNGRAFLRNHRGVFSVADDLAWVRAAATRMTDLLKGECSADYRRGIQDALNELGYGLAEEDGGYSLCKK